MDNALMLEPVEVIPPAENPAKPKQLVRFVSGCCQATSLDSVDCDFSSTLEQALQCIENCDSAEK